MMHSIQTSACDCLKPLPLIKTNYLSEFRTDVERAKARENLGIADDMTLKWGSITGHIEDNKDLQDYIKEQQKFDFSSDFVTTPITTILEGLKYILDYITFQEGLGTSLTQLKEDCKNLSDLVGQLIQHISESDESNAEQIKTVQDNIDEVNLEIVKINEAIQAIDVLAASLEWLKSAVSGSKTISLNESLDEEGNDTSVIEVKISEDDLNSAETKEDGIYVKDLSPDIALVKMNQSNMKETLNKLESSVAYVTELPDYTSSPTVEGLTVADLKEKSLSEIVDSIFFPASVRSLVYPKALYASMPTMVQQGASISTPEVIYNAGDAGDIVSEENVLLFNGNPSTDTSYSQIGTYTHKHIINYADGAKLINNRGEETSRQIKAGSVEAILDVVVSRPWYAGNVSRYTAQPMVPFNEVTDELEVNLDGKAVIKLPGANSTLNSFKLDSGIGILAVNMEDWSTSKETIDGFPYSVWTKKSSYSSIVLHKVKFKLVQ